jgi:fumarate hydratase subunit alpha
MTETSVKETIKEINVGDITKAVKKLCMDANIYLPDDVKAAFKKGMEEDPSPVAREIFKRLIENYEISEKDKTPLCQDCGLAVLFVELGQDVRLTGGDFAEAINEGVRQGYQEGFLRKSAVWDPIFERKNTKDNTPAIIYTDIVPGNKLKITMAPKGGGSENMSALGMLTPAQGAQGVKKFVVDVVDRAGSNPCPPIVLGIGIGGTADKAMQLSKKALLRDLNSKSPEPILAKMEEEILEDVNKLGIGPQGFGGRTTALAVNILAYPCHIASMPIAVNIQCHSARHKEITL